MMPTASQQKENDPSFGRLKRLSSITSITSPIGQIASKFRRPSTTLPSLNSAQIDTHERKPVLMPYSRRQSSGNSSHSHVKTSAIPRLPDKPATKWVPRQAEVKLPKSRTMSNLPLLARHEPSHLPLPGSYSTTNLSNGRLPTPVDTSKTPRQRKNFLVLRKSSNSALSNFKTPSKLPLSSLNTPGKSSFAEGLAGVREVAEYKPNAFVIPRKQIASPVGSNQSAGFGLSRKQREWKDKVQRATQQYEWQQKTQSNIIRTSRTSIEEEYEALQPSTKAFTSSTGESSKSPRHSYNGDITHHQLMTPLSPPLPRLPAGYSETHTPPSLASARLVRQVTQAQPPSYWSGRYTSLNDRLLNEAMDTCSSFPNPFVPGKPGKAEEELSRLAGSVHGEAHAQHILDLLYAACVTEEALRSLRIWQLSFGRLRHMPNLATYTPASAFTNLVAGPRNKERESLVLGSTSGNRHHQYTGGIYGDRRLDREMSEESIASSEVSAATVIRNVSVEALPQAGTVRKTSFIDRLLSSGRKISGKASVLGGSALHTAEGDHEELIAR